MSNYSAQLTIIMWWCCKIWLILILGLTLNPHRSEGRAVNISNTWTLPQDGFTVFYRFFRDKISWFEADAVCQFHHASLVTVENSFQFDATRDFLKALDVVEPVWIGLMRAQNSKRFAWSNSKPLPSESGYWAEPLPVMEAPLCAVIDPVRDFRWHALRCGGPETASFLCEMNVPGWAEECTLTEMPSLTIQYMADSGSVELSKDCGEEGTIHQICKGKQDMARILKELICKNEKSTEIGQNSLTATDLADTHYKSLEIIKSVPTDNNEDNNIGTQLSNNKSKEEKKEIEQNPVQKLIEQFNVEELMQSDQPHIQIPDEIPKPVKKTVKKAKAFEKKDKSAKKAKELKTKEKPFNLEELMMGDQPAPDLDISEAAEEPLPHIKKSLPQDLRHVDTTTTEILTTISSKHETAEIMSASSAQQSLSVSPSILPEPTSLLTTSSGLSSSSSSAPLSSSSLSSEIDKTSSSTSSTITTAFPAETMRSGIIHPHPMHPHQRRDGNIFNPSEETGIHQVNIQDGNDNHFIPPMLLVKSHYTSTKSHLEPMETHHTDPSVKHEIISDSNVLISQHQVTTSATNANIESIINPLTNTTNTAATTADNTLMKITEKVSSTTFEPPQSASEHQIVEIKIGNSDNPTTFSITTRPIAAEMSPNLSSTSAKTNEHDQNSGENSNIEQNQNHQQQQHNHQHQHQQHQQQQQQQEQHNLHHGIIMAKNEFPTTKHYDNHSSDGFSSASRSSEKLNSMEDQSKVKNNFSNEENFHPYTPNRRRVLTKPTITTYLKKILG